MPYINQRDRPTFEAKCHELGFLACNVGELTYIFYKIMCSFLAKEHTVRFERLAVCLAALEAAKLEWYRRKVAPYEDIKIEENGDVE